MEPLKSFFTGWASGHDLASQDNQRYTTLNSQALANTGTMNRQMLDHVNDVQSMVLQGKDKFGQPLPARQKREMTELVAKYQMPYSQGVFSPAPWDLPPEPDAPLIDKMRAPMPPPAMPAMPARVLPAIDINSAFAPLPPMQQAPPVINPGISSQMQIPPVTAPAMPPIQQGNLTMPPPMPPPMPQPAKRRKAKKKVTVRPSQADTSGIGLKPELSSLR